MVARSDLPKVEMPLAIVLLASAYGGSLTLKYFDARGAAETTRVLLAIGGLQYEDKRYKIGPGFDAPEFKAEKESGALLLNLNRAPILMTDEGSIGQSKSMERYVAREAGLMGRSSFEAATIDMVAEHVRDVRDAQQRKGFSKMARGKTDEEKATLSAEWYGADLPAIGPIGGVCRAALWPGRDARRRWAHLVRRRLHLVVAA